MDGRARLRIAYSNQKLIRLNLRYILLAFSGDELNNDLTIFELVFVPLNNYWNDILHQRRFWKKKTENIHTVNIWNPNFYVLGFQTNKMSEIGTIVRTILVQISDNYCKSIMKNLNVTLQSEPLTTGPRALSWFPGNGLNFRAGMQSSQTPNESSMFKKCINKPQSCIR